MVWVWGRVGLRYLMSKGALNKAWNCEELLDIATALLLLFLKSKRFHEVRYHREKWEIYKRVECFALGIY